MTLSRPRAVLFDLDGTLINTAPEFIHIAAELRREASLPVMDTQTIWHSVSDGAIGMVQAALEHVRGTTPPLSCGDNVFSPVRNRTGRSANHTPACENSYPRLDLMAYLGG